MGSTASIYHTIDENSEYHGSDYKESYDDAHHGREPSSHSYPHENSIPPRHPSTKETAPTPHRQHIAKNVNQFLNHQISQVSVKIHEQRSQSVPKINAGADSPPKHHIRQVQSSTQLMKKTNSTVRAHALRLHSRQKNTYINASSLRFSSHGSGIVNRDRSNDHSGNSIEQSLQNEQAAANDPATKTDNPIKKKFNLKLQINDEDDWIQVDDDEANDIMTPRIKKEALGHNDQSYTLTQSGTIFVNGFGEGIGKNGLAVGSRYQTKLPMRERLVFLCQLGQGASSTVYKALDLTELRLVAVKMIPVFDRTKRRQMVRELNALFQMLRKKERELKNPSSGLHVDINFDLNRRKLGLESESKEESKDGVGYKLYSQQYIVDFYDAFSNLEEGGVALMMEYMDGGSLQDLADTGGCSDEGVLANIAVQALAGLDFLHKCNQIHRDIKPANLLINLDGDVKVSDLGILRQIDPSIDIDPEKKLHEQDVNKLHRAHTFVGTTTYMAPERIDGQEYSYSSDIWSFGLSMMTLSLGRLPFDASGGFWRILQSVRDSAPPRLPQDQGWSKEYCNFIELCLQHSPDDRPSASELLKHPFISKAFPESGENMESIGADELRSIVKALYAHLETVRNDSLKSLIGGKSSARLKSAREALERMESTSSTLTPSEKFHPTASPATATMTATLGGTGTTDVPINLPTTYEMANVILFGEKTPVPSTKSAKLCEEKSSSSISSKSDISTSYHHNAPSSSSNAATNLRFKELARQLHLPLPIAIHVARTTLLSLYEESHNSSKSATPKSKHSTISNGSLLSHKIKI